MLGLRTSLTRLAGPISLAALLAALLVAALVLPSGSSPDPVVAGGIANAIDESETVWWSAVGENSCAVLNLGPLLDLSDGESVRRWNLMMHRPGTARRLSCIQGIARYDDSGAITAEGPDFRLEIRPRRGFTWGSVLETEALEATVEGLE